MKVVAASDAAALTGLLDAGWSAPPEIVEEVAQIIAGVRARGDAALVEYTRRFDDPHFKGSKLRVAIPQLDDARSTVPREIATALELAKERASRFHERQRLPDVAYVEADGTRYALERRALASAAIYAARGDCVAVVMGAVPAKIAGVARIVVLAPTSEGGVSPAVLFACALCGVDELYAVGGAQAIAAAAFGTESIAPVQKIAGRGGVRTTEAKRQVFGRCGIDALAGPVEGLIVADDGASSEYVVGDLLALAERQGVTRLGVLSESRSLLEAVAQLVDTLDLQTVERREFVSKAVFEQCRLIEARTRQELFETLNRFAPAYLCLQVRDASAYLDRINAAGTVLVGDMTPLAGAEYLAGSSHAVPTAGTARFASCLSPAEFTRTFSVVENTAERATADAGPLAFLAEYDGLPHHAHSARMRCGQ